MWDKVEGNFADITCGLTPSGSFWSGDEEDHGPAFIKSGLRFAGFYRRGVRSGLAFEINPSYSTFTYGTVDISGHFSGVNISQVVQGLIQNVNLKHNAPIFSGGLD